MSLNADQSSKLLLKNFLNVPFNKPTGNFFDETNSYTDYIIGENILVDEIPPTPNFTQSSTMNIYDQNNIFIGSITIETDITNTVQKLVRVPLIQFDSTNTQAYTAYDSSGNNVLKNAFQFNYGDGTSYDYTLYIKNGENVSDKILRSNSNFPWIFNFKSGYIVFFGNIPTPSGTVSQKLELTIVRYIGKKGVNNITGIGGGKWVDTTTGEKYLGNAENINIYYENGAVLIGKNELSTENNVLEISGNIDVNGRMVVRKGITNYSDRRLKSDIEQIDNALERIDKLNGVKYTMYGDRHVGLIAQDVLEVLPEAVQLHSNGYYSLEYGNMVGLLVEGIKQLTKQNQDLYSRIQVLEEKMHKDE